MKRSQKTEQTSDSVKINVFVVASASIYMFTGFNFKNIFLINGVF